MTTPTPRTSGLAAAIRARLDAEPWAYVSGPHRAVDLRFRFRTSDPVLGAYLAEVFASFVDDEPGAADHPDLRWYTVHERPGEGHRRKFRAWFETTRLQASATGPLALGYVLWSFNREVVAAAQNCLLFHSSAVAKDGNMVMFPATQESGKTTLCAGMLRRGWHYVTDECVAFDRSTGAVRPFQKALSIDYGSWSLFPELTPDYTPQQERYIREQWHMPPTRISELATGTLTPRLLISPRYVKTGETALTEVSRAQGLLLLAGNCFAPQAWPGEGLETAAGLLRGMRCGEMTVASLEEACDTVEAAMEATLAGDPLPSLGRAAEVAS